MFALILAFSVLFAGSEPISLPGPIAPAGAPRVPLLAILPLDPQGVAKQHASLLSDALGTHLQAMGDFRLIERAQIDRILLEQGFQGTGACNVSECAVEVGRLLGMDQMVLGSVGRIGETYMMSARRVAVESGEILSSASTNYTGRIDGLLTESIPQLARQLAIQRMPGRIDPIANRSAVQSIGFLLDAKRGFDSTDCAQLSQDAQHLTPDQRMRFWNDYRQSRWTGLFNVPLPLGIGHVVQHDWSGFMTLFAAAIAAGALIEHDQKGFGLTVYTTAWAYSILRGFSVPHRRNVTLRRALRVDEATE